MKKNIMTWVSIGFFCIIIALSIGISFFPELDPNEFDPYSITGPEKPSLSHIFGTDELGRDIFIRCIHGAKVSLMIGVTSVSISVILGMLLGLIAGFFSRTIDEIIMRFVDIMMGIPTLFLILTIQIILTPSIYNVIVIIGLTSWMGVARMVRAETLRVKESLFISAAVSRGIPKTHILMKHILPHTLTPVIVATMLGMGNAILAESVLSFLGLGVQPPHASWGNMLENSLGFMFQSPWMTFFPGLLITLTVLSLNYLGDSLREKLNAKEHTHT